MSKMTHSPQDQKPLTITAGMDNNEVAHPVPTAPSVTQLNATTSSVEAQVHSTERVSENVVSLLDRKRLVVRAALFKEINEVENMLTDHSVEINKIEAYVESETIVSMHEQLEKLEDQLEEAVRDWSELELSKRFSERTQISKRVRVVVRQLQQVASAEDDSASVESSRSGAGAAAAAPTQQVVKIVYEKQNSVPRFYGDVKQFRMWYELFDKYVDKNNELMPIEKFKVLRESLAGRAANEIAHLHFEDSQYAVALEAIKKKFGGESGAEEAHLKEIRRICATDLRRPNKLNDGISAIILNTKALVALGKSYEALSLAVTPLILEGLPFSLAKAFSKEYSHTQTDRNTSKLQALLEFLEEDCKATEEVNSARASAGQNSKNTQYQAHSHQTHKSLHDRQDKPYRQGYSFQATAQKTDKCIFCDGAHLSQKCKKQMSLEQRKEIVVREQVCFRCLSKNHVAKKCRSRQANCSVCNRRHFPIMCDRKSLEARSNKSDRQASNSQGLSTTNASNSSSEDSATFLQTGYVQASVGKICKVARTLLDSGSQKSYISRNLAKLLNSKPFDYQSMVVYSIGGQVSKVQRMPIHRLELRSRFQPTKSISVECLEMSEITRGELPHIVDAKGFSPIADKINGSSSSAIDILLGSDNLPLVFTGQEVIVDNIMASNTIFGWFFMGRDERTKNEKRASTLCAFQVCSQFQPLVESESDESTVSGSTKDDLKFLWDVEQLGIESPGSDDSKQVDKEVEEYFRKTIKRQEDGSYMVSLPFKSNIDALGDNRNVARHRLQRFLASNKDNLELLSAVDAEMQNALDQGFIERAEPPKEGELVHYLPVQAVVKSSSTSTKVRIVKDASCRSKGVAALNDVLHQGTCLIPDLLKSIMLFRKYKIAIVADIQKAFLQFKIDPAHRTFLRFFWPLNISKDKNAEWVEFWSTRLDFGLISSPFLHIAGIKYHLENEISRLPSEKNLLEEVASHFYVDDIVSGANSEKEAKERVKTLLEVFSSGKFPLMKWATNDKSVGEFLRQLPELKEAKIVCEDVAVKFLGICWNQQTDEIKVFAENAIKELISNIPTKRVLLKGLSQVFDPVGLAQPVVLKAKILLQKLWLEKVDWDIELKGTHQVAFEDVVTSFCEISKLSISRRLHSHARKTELHVFTDASLVAYGCVAYIRYVFHDKTVKTVFLLAKARVAPTKGNWNIHRLELLGAVLAVRMANKIKKVLELAFDSVTFWTDNAAVLGWVNDSPDRWKPFVANRVKEIQASSVPSQWLYVKSCHNVSDIASRGTLTESADNVNVWLNGPVWLQTDGHPGYTLSECKNKDSEKADWFTEAKTSSFAIATKKQEQTPSALLDASKFSSFKKIVRIAAFVLRFIDKCRQRRSAISSTLSLSEAKVKATQACVSASEYEKALATLIRNVQQIYYATELDSGCKIVPKDSKIVQYRPFVDEHGILRCRSRLEKATELSYDEKFPIILPAQDPFVGSLLLWAHVDVCLHSGGVAETLHHLRQKYLVLGARKAVKSVLKKCMVCARYKAKSAAEVMPPLPAFRVDRCAAFSITACDFAGPLKVSSENKGKCKAYIALFTCTVTRAVHLELVVGLSTAEFLLALRRFINRRPTVTRFISDNGKTFKRTAKELKLLFEHVKSKDVQAVLSNAQITWEFITEYAPWHGGVWERMVQTVKRPLRKILGTNVVSATELATILTDIESMVNMRPIARVELNPDEAKALTPSDLLYGYQGKTFLPDTTRIAKVVNEASAEVFSRRWRHQQNILNAFWRRFKEEYLQFLRSAHAVHPVNRRPISEGDVCILQDPSPSRAFWPLCRVLSLTGGGRTDLRKRSCLIKLATGQILRRPIQLLYPLELQ